mmetsp:Transcript_13908/g.23672  ORF Transcript_13908/g.23672 Transcript_13908/m.23672 type:complete len:331 (-) Transcript_13908:8-1000(-)
MGEEKDNRVSSEKNNSIYANAAAGLIGSSTAKVFVHPIDTLKAKIQVMRIERTKAFTLSNSVLASTFRDTFRAEGLGGLYRGFAVALLGSMPASILYFGSYEFFKRNSLENEYLQKRPFLAYLAGGMFAESVACILFVPVDVIKERRQVQHNLKKYNYTNDIDAIRQIKQSEGVRGLYRAYGATVMSFGPFSALYFTFYETMKGLFLHRTLWPPVAEREEESFKPEIGFFPSMICSMFAGGAASILTNPLDIAKLRLQVQRAGAASSTGVQDFYYKHMVDAMFKIGRDEGFRALYNGSLARVLYHVPTVAISMSVLERVKPSVKNWLASQ